VLADDPNRSCAEVDAIARIWPRFVSALRGCGHPCSQLNTYQSGLMAAVLDRDADGNVIRKAGIMGVVLAGGEIRPDAVSTLSRPRRPSASQY
jgi:MOSC domain-containing protein YiiM